MATYFGGLNFSHSDWQGTERVRHTYGTGAGETCTSLPFGDNLVCTPAEPFHYRSPLHFTGKERDFESGLDYFGARYYTSALGRFMTPDWAERPITVPYAAFGDPQSLNLYSYVRNDPVTQVDADGHRGGPDPDTNCATIGACGEGSEFPESGQKQDQTKLVVTMTVVVPSMSINSSQNETVVAFGIARMDKDGNISALDKDEEHKLTMTETLDEKKSKGQKPPICSSGCSTDVDNNNPARDVMRVSGKNVVVLDKTFQIDGNAAQVYDPKTKKTGDYVHQESTFKGGTKLTIEDNSP